MDVRFSEEEEFFRKEASKWLDKNIPDMWRQRKLQPFGEIPQEDQLLEGVKEFQVRLFEAGLAAISWPREYGGRGASAIKTLIFEEEKMKHRAPPQLNLGAISQLGPVLISMGTKSQKERFLEPMLKGEEIWCQGFSEPDAGSDLASLITRAEDKGEHFLLNGQKVWTSMLTRYADWCYALVRTDEDAPKHLGITYILIDMRSRGVTVRPLKNIAGSEEFNELFFDDVEVPKENVVGRVNDGWKIAQTNLSHERMAIGLAFNFYNQWYLEELIGMAKEMKRTGKRVTEDAQIRQKIAQAYIEVEIGKLNALRSVSKMEKGGAPGPEASIARLWSSTVNQRMMELAMEILGPYSQLDKGSPHCIEDGFWQYAYLRSKGHTIAAGTSEIQKNIISEKILGLPRG